ncbi:phage tail protein [uncultured Mediterranean phage uvMED]|nr:phage tail protein [uncultured Mediterranean phage uvMED]
MPGALDSLFKNVAKSVVADLGKSLDTTVTYTRKASPTYNTSTGALTTTDTSYSFNAPIEFVDSEEEEGREERKGKLYITPDLIGDSQPTLEDTLTLKYAGSNRAAQITDIRTYKGGQEYLFIVQVRF